MRLIDLELSPTTTPPNTAGVLKVLQSALGSNLSIEDKTGTSLHGLLYASCSPVYLATFTVRITIKFFTVKFKLFLFGN